jgi:hypothetical protein
VESPAAAGIEQAQERSADSQLVDFLEWCPATAADHRRAIPAHDRILNDRLAFRAIKVPAFKFFDVFHQIKHLESSSDDSNDQLGTL